MNSLPLSPAVILIKIKIKILSDLTDKTATCKTP